MGIDAAGQHIQPAGVDDLHAFAHDHVFADGVDDAVLHQDIGHVIVGGRDDAAIADQGGVHGVQPMASSRWRISRSISCTVL